MFSVFTCLLSWKVFCETKSEYSLFTVNLILMDSLALTLLSKLTKQFQWLHLFTENLDLVLEEHSKKHS